MTSRKQSNSDKSARKVPQQPKKITAPPQQISYSIAHTIPGRVRFRIPKLGTDSEYAEKLKQVIESDSRVHNVRVNRTAASIVIHYQANVISEKEMRLHLIKLVQTAPKIVLPPPVTAKSIVAVIFDAVINLIDSTRNINKARNAIQYKRFRTDFWERALSSAKGVTKGVKSAIMFVLPNKKRRLPSLPDEWLQPLKLQAVGEGGVS